MPSDAKKLFEAVLKRPEAERQAFLAGACPDAALRSRVELLLKAQAKADPFLDRPAAEHLTNDSPARPNFLEPSDRTDALGRLGHHEVLECVGQGGMGIVFRAFDAKLHRVVAIKALAPLLAFHAPTRQRFLREARAAAAVAHEHVVAIHAVEDDGPVPFIIMQFVQGRTLQEKIDATGPLPLADTLRIAAQAALGLAAAHKQGLVHRDMKPANILLENGIERVRLCDFGLARAASDASLTRAGGIAGTPAYMSPEQANGKPLDARSDLFSLGGVLYAMVTGNAPHEGETAAVLKQVSQGKRRPVLDANPNAPAWLAAVVDKLMALDPKHRFATADEVAELLGRRLAEVQSGVAIPAPRRPSWKTWTRLGAAAVLLAAAGIAMLTVQPPRDERKEVKDDLPATASTLLPTEPYQLKPARTFGGHSGGVLTVAYSPNGKLLASAGEDRTILLRDLGTDAVRTIPTKHGSDIVGLQFSPDGTRLASVVSGGDDCCVRLWDVAAGRPAGTLGEGTGGQWGGLWSRDGKRIAAAGWDRTLRIWDVAGGSELVAQRDVCPQFVRSLDLSPSGEWITTGGNGPTRLWNARTGEEIVTEPMPAMCPSFLGSNAIAGWNHGAGRVIVCEVPSGKVRMAWPAHTGLIEGLACSADGRFVLTFNPQGEARLWHVAGTEPVEVATLSGHRGSIFAAAFSPDGTKLATAGKGDFTVRLWDLPAICHIRKP